MNGTSVPTGALQRSTTGATGLRVGTARTVAFVAAVAAGMLATGTARASDKPADKAAEEKSGPVSYLKDIEPLFIKHCVGCHSSADPKGGLNMETVALTQKGGKKGAGWTAGSKGKAADSIFMKYLDGRLQPQMPKGKKPLQDRHIALIKRWIDEGAIDDGGAKPTRLPRSTGPTEGLNLPPQITAIAWDPADRFVAVSGYRRIVLLDPATAKETGALYDVTQKIHALQFDKEGKVLAAAGGVPGQLGEVTLYDPATRKTIGTLEDTKDSVYALALSADGRRIATGGPDKLIRIYDVAKRELVSKIDDHADWVMALQFSADGKQLVSGSRDKTVKFWDADKGERLQASQGNNESVAGAVFLSDGKTVAALQSNRQVKLFNIADGKAGKGFGVNAEPQSLALASDGKTIAVGTADGSVHVIDTVSGKTLQKLAGLTDYVYAVAFSPDGKKVAAGNYGGTVMIWTVADGKKVAEWSPKIAAPAAAAAAK